MKSPPQLNLFTDRPNLQLAEDGIYYAAVSEAISYPEEGNEACFEVIMAEAKSISTKICD